MSHVLAARFAEFFELQTIFECALIASGVDEHPFTHRALHGSAIILGHTKNKRKLMWKQYYQTL